MWQKWPEIDTETIPPEIDDIIAVVFIRFVITWPQSIFHQHWEYFCTTLPHGTSSNGNASPNTGLCEGNLPVTGGFQSKCETWCFFDVSPNKLLNKHSSGRWSETPWRSLHFTDHRFRINPILTGGYDFWQLYFSIARSRKRQVGLQNKFYMYETINKSKWRHINGLFEFVIDPIITS